MSSILSTVLQCSKPDYWETTDYTNVRYKRFPVSALTNEYKSVETEFRNEYGSAYLISEITRIQHPYAYASYQIRRKHLGVINNMSTPGERRIFFRIPNPNQVDEFLEFNCDSRKATCPSNGNLSVTDCVVLAKEITGYSYKTRSSNRYPDYLIRCKPKQSTIIDPEIIDLSCNPKQSTIIEPDEIIDLSCEPNEDILEIILVRED